jgi:hypothetical protein
VSLSSHAIPDPGWEASKKTSLPRKTRESYAEKRGARATVKKSRKQSRAWLPYRFAGASTRRQHGTSQAKRAMASQLDRIASIATPPRFLGNIRETAPATPNYICPATRATRRTNYSNDNY